MCVCVCLCVCVCKCYIVNLQDVLFDWPGRLWGNARLIGWGNQLQFCLFLIFKIWIRMENQLQNSIVPLSRVRPCLCYGRMSSQDNGKVQIRCWYGSGELSVCFHRIRKTESGFQKDWRSLGEKAKRRKMKHLTTPCLILMHLQVVSWQERLLWGIVKALPLPAPLSVEADVY